jgi:Cu(I)/Ag(I) efflux system membrane fusion protein
MRAESYVQKFADVTTGAHVVKGQPLMEIYSPRSLRRPPNTSRPSLPKVTGGGDGPYGRGSRQRLMNLDVPDAAIVAMEKGRNVPIGIEWTSPRDGIVLETQRHRRHARPARREPVSDRRSLGWCGRSSTSPSAILGAMAVGQRTIVRARSFPGGSFQERST